VFRGGGGGWHFRRLEAGPTRLPVDDQDGGSSGDEEQVLLLDATAKKKSESLLQKLVIKVTRSRGADSMQQFRS
jgi:hypothetical protein